MARNVEYDRIEAALRDYNPTIAFLNCIPRPFTRMGSTIASLEPLIMILRKPKNARWLAWWAPLIHMRTGFAVTEMHQIYIQSSWERDAIEGVIPATRRIAGTRFEHRDLQHVVENIQRERTTVGSGMASYREGRNRASEAARVIPAVVRA